MEQPTCRQRDGGLPDDPEVLAHDDAEAWGDFAPVFAAVGDGGFVDHENGTGMDASQAPRARRSPLTADETR